MIEHIRISYSPTLTFEQMKLHNGRERDPSLFHNSGWYILGSKKGSCPKIGWGDLGVLDVLTIEESLKEGEALFILHEEDSFWGFVTENPGLVGACCKTAPAEKDPGLDFVLEKLAGVVTKGGFYKIVDPYFLKKTGEKEILKGPWGETTLEKTYILKEDVRKILSIV